MKIAHKDDYNAMQKRCEGASCSVAGACNKDYDVTRCSPIPFVKTYIDTLHKCIHLLYFTQYSIHSQKSESFISYQKNYSPFKSYGF